MVLDSAGKKTFHIHVELEKAVSFGRQKNLVRRPVRPNGRINRDLRRRTIGKNTLLDVQSARPSLSVRLARLVAKLLGK